MYIVNSKLCAHHVYVCVSAYTYNYVSVCLYINICTYAYICIMIP